SGADAAAAATGAARAADGRLHRRRPLGAGTADQGRRLVALGSRSRRLGHETELGHDLNLIEIQPRVCDRVALDAEDLYTASLQVTVRRRDLTARARQRVLVRPLERELLRDPVA